MNRDELFKQLDQASHTQAVRATYIARLGDGQGNLYVILPDGTREPGRVWARVEGIGIVTVRCRKVANQKELPVIVGVARDGQLEVIEENGDEAIQFAGQLGFNVGPHRNTHDLMGTDPDMIRSLRLLPLLCAPTTPPSLSVYVYPYSYEYGGTRKTWPGGNIALSSEVPTSGSEQKLIIVCLDPATNTLTYYAGATTTPWLPGSTAVPFLASDIDAIDTGSDWQTAAIRAYAGQTRFLWPDWIADRRDWIGTGGGGGSGTVTSVGFSAAPSSVFGVTGSPVTGSGTLALSMDDQDANKILAGPVSGGATAPAFRALVASDMPDLSASYAQLPLFDAANPSASAPGDTVVVGTATVAAHRDHRHAREAWGVAGDIVASTLGGSAAAGATGKVADAAHKHALAALAANDYPTMVGDSGAGGTKGAAPAPVAGDAAAGKFLSADATFKVPEGASVQANLIPNSSFEVWENGTAVPPDGWTLTGAGASVARSTTTKTGLYSAAITRSGTDCHLSRDVYATLGSTYIRSRPLIVGAWVYATVASRALVRVSDGVTTWFSSYHTGDSTWQWLTVAITPGSSVTQLVVGGQVDTGNTTAYFDGFTAAEGTTLSYRSPGFIPFNALPQRAFGMHFNAIVKTGNALSMVAEPQQMLNSAPRQSAAADGDNFTYSAFLAAGTYTLSVMGIKSTVSGKLDWYIDGVIAIIGQDWYAAAPVYNAIMSLSLTVIGDGYHVVEGKVNGKNGSSSGYLNALTCWSINPTVD
jgi:hypothetical protein